MRVVYDSRASAIIYNLIKSNINHFKDKQIILPSNICPIVPISLMKADIDFIFIDIDRETLCLDHKLLLDFLKTKGPIISCIFYVRTFGYIEDLEVLFNNIVDNYPNILIVDDRCAGIPDFSLKERTKSHIVLFSTGYAKYVEIGWGGFAFIDPNIEYNRNELVFNNGDHERLIADINASISKQSIFNYKHNDWLENSIKMPLERYIDIILKEIIKVKNHKNQLNAIYREYIPKEISLMDGFQNWRFSLFVDKKEDKIDKNRKQSRY